MSNLITKTLATHRLTRLIISDELTEPLRQLAFKHLDRNKNPLTDKIAYFLTCPWCVSMWVSLSLLALEIAAPTCYKHLTRSLASSSVTGLIYDNLQS